MKFWDGFRTEEGERDANLMYQGKSSETVFSLPDRATYNRFVLQKLQEEDFSKEK